MLRTSLYSSRAAIAGVALTAAVSAWMPGGALAQDRLFVGTPNGAVEVGTFGRFGQAIGPAPADALTRRLPRVSHFVSTATTLAHATTGAVVYTAPAGESITGWAATPDASRVYVTTWGAGFAPPRLHAIDVASHGVVAEVALADFSTAVRWLPGDRVVVDGGVNNRALAFDRDLRPLALLEFATACSPMWLVSPHTGRAYVMHFDGYDYGGAGLSVYLSAFDTVKGAFLGRADLSRTIGASGSSCGVGALLWAAPGPPAQAPPVVNGRDVTLSWLAADLAEGYVVDVGVAPGRTDLTMFVGRTTSLTFANAPAGTYYVRIRAGNVMGGGRPSNEVRVVVP